MVTLGIDLAAEPRNTGGCEIEWRDGGAAVRWVSTDLRDEDVLERAREADMVGIDAPFGWPTSFVDAVTAHHSGRAWPIDSWSSDNRRKLRLRVTDERVHAVTGITPLSVSSDAIAIPATRCALLLHRLGVRDRAADARVREVYPAAALFQWELRHRGYKGQQNSRVLGTLLARLRKRAPWLVIAAQAARFCATCDDAFDALVASLVARAASEGLTMAPGADEVAAARAEGWIALPDRGSLEKLVPAHRAGSANDAKS